MLSYRFSINLKVVIEGLLPFCPSLKLALTVHTWATGTGKTEMD